MSDRESSDEQEHKREKTKKEKSNSSSEESSEKKKLKTIKTKSINQITKMIRKNVRKQKINWRKIQTRNQRKINLKEILKKIHLKTKK